MHKWSKHHCEITTSNKGYTEQVSLSNDPVTTDKYSKVCVISTETPASLSKEDCDAHYLVIYLASLRAPK